MSILRDDERQMEAVRRLVLGEDNRLVRDTVKEDARQLVGSVLTEALHDRQKSDGTVQQVITPLVEKSVEASVVNRREQFVGILYPLVGRLVRKSVSAFLADLMERTNALLESSLSLRGLKWRFKAWQAGVSYSQYVVSQTFLFRVEQVLLIHRETGLLLRTVTRHRTQAADADMVSAMLTAINDFVSDSFTLEENDAEQNLDEIKTDDFTLLIKQGPKAVLVAAITGKVPAEIGVRLQITLEDIHRIYEAELTHFNGDSAVFEPTEQQLNDCLLAKQKESESQSVRVPWAAWLVLALLIAITGYFVIERWRLEHAVGKIRQLPATPGITLVRATPCNPNICVELLRDPDAKTAHDWLAAAGVAEEIVRLNERAYFSLAPELVQHRLKLLAEQFPELSFNQAQRRFEGNLSEARLQAFKTRLSALPDRYDPQQMISGIQVPQQVISDSQMNGYLLEQLIAEVELAAIDFASNESNLSESAAETLSSLSHKLKKLHKLAGVTQAKIQVVAMGVSDSVGSVQYNQQLSTERATTVRRELIRLGVSPEFISTAGLGVLDASKGVRRVVFGVIRLGPEPD